MRQTQAYTASQYNRESGFPLGWACRCCFIRQVQNTIEEEAEEYRQRTKTHPDVIINRPPGREAYQGVSAMKYDQQRKQQEQQGQRQEELREENERKEEDVRKKQLDVKQQCDENDQERTEEEVVKSENETESKVEKTPIIVTSTGK